MGGIPTLKIGDKFTTKEGYEIVIISYVNGHMIEIEFQDANKCRKFSTSQNIKLGHIKNPFHPSVCGIGFLGVGEHQASINKTRTKVGKCWYGMIHRCYDESALCKYPAYENVFVCVYWLNFQNFAEWCYKQIGFGNDGWHLDKDLLFKGNREYKSDVCVFLPPEINLFMVKNDSRRGMYAIGVSYDIVAGKYIASCGIHKSQVNLGYFNTELEAFLAYKTAKENEAKRLAEKWKDQIDPRAYQALMNYEVEMDD